MSPESTEWKLVRLPDFKPPAEPTTETLRKSLRELWRRVRGGASERDREPVIKDLKEAGSRLIRRVAPEPSWQGAATSILEALPELREPDSSVQRVLVGGPRNGIDQGVRVLARERQWDVLETPTFQEILEGGAKFVDRIDWSRRKVLVVPRLDDLIMRQFDGLNLLRRWLDRVLTSRRPCLIVCGSWAWAFLARSIQLDSVFPTPLTQHAFDAVNLGKWFRELAASKGGGDLRFLQADIGTPVLPRPASGRSAEERDAEWEDLSGYLKYAAAYCRGNPAVALEVWRASLRTSREEGPEEEPEAEPPKATVGDPDVVWVSPWSELELPSAPSSLSRLETFVLHALLIHAGLEPESLGHVLSIDQQQTMKTLTSLQRVSLVEAEGTTWKVATVAYPAVRNYLFDEDYLTDKHLRRST